MPSSNVHLNILIISNDSDFKKKVLNLIQGNSDGFDCRIDVVSQLDEKVDIADLIFVDTLEVNYAQIFSSIKSTAEVVLCATNSDIAGIPPSYLQRFSEIFLSNTRELILEARILRLFNRVIENRREYMAHAWLDTLINTIPEMIWFKDKVGAHLKVNDRFCEVVGKDKSDIEGRGHYYIWDITPEDYSQGEFICLESEEVVMDAKEMRVFDETVKVKDDTLSLKTFKSPIFDSDGEIVGTLGYAQDVTELSKRGAIADTFLNSFAFPILMLDKDNNIEKVNNCYEKDFAFLACGDELQGTSLDDWLDDHWEILDYSNNLSNMTASINIDGVEKTFSLLHTNKSKVNHGSFLICLES